MSKLSGRLALVIALVGAFATVAGPALAHVTANPVAALVTGLAGLGTGGFALARSRRG